MAGVLGDVFGSEFLAAVRASGHSLNVRGVIGIAVDRAVIRADL
jgi:hypothetical protein